MKTRSKNKASMSYAPVILVGALVFSQGCSPKVQTVAATTVTATASPTPGGGGSSGSTFAELMASSCFRSDNESIDFTNQSSVDARIRALLSDESAGNLVSSGNSLVPNPLYDTDGRYSPDGDGAGVTGIVEKRNYLETVKGRPTKVCGVSGSTSDRVTECSNQNGVKATWEGSKYGLSGEGDWSLVALASVGYCYDQTIMNQTDCTNNYGASNWISSLSQCGIPWEGQNTCVNNSHTLAPAQAPNTVGSICVGGSAGGCLEVWRDERTQLVWSDLHNNGGNNYNWFQAAGFSKNASTITQTYFEGGRPSDTGLTYNLNCDSDWQSPPTSTTTCQPEHPVSVCADAGVLNTASTNGISTYQNPDGTDVDGIGIPDERPNKGNMTGASHQWRLPTIEDYKLADVNGMRKVLPNMDNAFWSASSNSGRRYNAWNFYGGDGNVYYDNRNSGKGGVRCVGR